jgi:hypothetical protein
LAAAKTNLKSIKKMKKFIPCCVALIGIVSLLDAQCPPEATTSIKTNRLFLYFPTIADNTFGDVEFGAGSGVQTRPLNPFNVADLNASIGTTAQLRNRIFQKVSEDYCEFNVEVRSTTTKPNPVGTDWNIIGISSDFDIHANDLFGLAQAADIGNIDREDFARVWSGVYKEQYGNAGNVLHGTNATLERWANAIGHTTSHEAGHNYGLTHSDSHSKVGEDDTNHHVMASGVTNLTGEERCQNRHFSDRSYEILGHNVGLNTKILYNWDFTNPNRVEARSFVLILLSTASTLTLNWSYEGEKSPWKRPTLVKTGATKVFLGTTYNVFTLTFSKPKSWTGGAEGRVPAGMGFHVGATFSEREPILVYETTLRNSAENNLPLHPRVISFDAGAADLRNGAFNVSIFNPSGTPNVIVRNVQVGFLPRMASIESMVADREKTLTDWQGFRVDYRNPSKSFTGVEKQAIEKQFTFKLAQFTDPRFVDITYDSTNCKKGFKKGAGNKDAVSGEVEYCPDGTALSLFPSTYIYLTATVVVQNTEFYDPKLQKMVRGDLENQVFYQFSGILPDFNKNGVDDLLDIRNNNSIDKNKNGIPDEAEKVIKKSR